MKLAETLVNALSERAVFYGVPFRRRGDQTPMRRVFGLNGLWFEMHLEDFVYEDQLRPGDPVVPRKAQRIGEIVMVPRAELGEMRLPRPAIVYPTLLASGSWELHDDVIEHRHLRFGNGGFGGKMELLVTSLDEGKPWRRPGTTDSIAIVEYTAEVAAARTGIEDAFAERVAAVLAERKREHQAVLLAEAGDNPLWGSW